MDDVPSRKTNGNPFYRGDDQLVALTYEKPEEILDILSAGGTKKVPKGTICAFCSRSENGQCSLNCWTPKGACKRFSLVREDIDVISNRIEHRLRSSLRLQSRAA